MLQKILNDIEFKEIDKEALRAETERLLNKYSNLRDGDKEFVVRARLRSIFGERSTSFKPQPLNIAKRLSERLK